MSIASYRFWEPVLELRPFRGFPENIAKTLRDRVLSFKFEDDKKFLDTVTLELDNGDGALFNLNNLTMGVTFKVFFGYPGILSPPRLMQCRKMKGAGRIGGLGPLSGPSTSVGGPMTLILKSQIWNMNFTRALSTIDRDVERDLLLESTTIPDAVRAIGRRHGFAGPSLFVEDWDEEPVIEKDSIPTKFSPAEWIINEARKRNWIFRINSDGLHFHSDDFEPQFSETYEENLSWFNGDPDVLEWSIDGDLNIPQDIQIMQSDLRGEASFSQLAATRAGGDRTAVTVLFESDPINKGRRLSPNLMLFATNRRSSIEQTINRMSKAIERWKLKLRLVGNPKVCVGRKIILRNFGPMVDGQWRVLKAVHNISPGQVYITNAEAKRSIAKTGTTKYSFGQLQFAVGFNERENATVLFETRN